MREWRKIKDFKPWQGAPEMERFVFDSHLTHKIISMRAELMELADMQDLGSCAVRRMGSSPIFRRKEK